jgi:predicted nucleic acid-binding protein
MITTYIDSGVLIAAARGDDDLSPLALPYLADPNREYITSDYVRLEVLPKAVFHQRQEEVDFYNEFFQLNTRSIPTSSALLEYALTEGCNTGIQGLDAIHIACAVFAGAEEFITSEKHTRPIHRTQKVRVISIHPPSAIEGPV